MAGPAHRLGSAAAPVAIRDRRVHSVSPAKLGGIGINLHRERQTSNISLYSYICSQHYMMSPYRVRHNISHILVGNKSVDHSDVVGASPVGAAPTTSSFSTWHLALMAWEQITSARWDEEVLGFGASYIRCLTVIVWCQRVYQSVYYLLSSMLISRAKGQFCRSSHAFYLSVAQWCHKHCQISCNIGGHFDRNLMLIWK